MTDTKIVQTQNGKVRGKKLLTTLEQKEYYAFKGIPFAQPPIGNLRFKAPQKAKPWDGVLDAFEYKSHCVQLEFFATTFGGSEDCLYINVFVPANAFNGEKLTTMLFIHGGGYQSGAPEWFGPDFLINQNVIVVVCAYRVGPLGFLSLGTKEFSGNMGLKDQRLGIQWVSENIEQFGGDKEKITLFGVSAGGSSVHFHVIVPETKKLFQRAIVQSGVAFNNWAYNPRSDDKSLILKYAEENNDELVDFEKYLLNIDVKKLIPFSSIPFYPLGSETKIPKMYWAPTVENKDAIDPFLTEPIENLENTTNSNQLDTLFGYSSVEMIFYTGQEYTNEALLVPFNENFKIQFPFSRNVPDFNSKSYKELADKVRTFYFGKNGTVNKASFSKYLDLLSDLWFSYNIDKSAKVQAKQSNGNTFLYKFSLDTKMDSLKNMAGAVAEVPGGSHGSDTCYLFHLHILASFSDFYKTIKKGSKEEEYILMVTKLWTDFAKYGKPDPTVKPIEGDIINYVDITNEGIVPGIAPNAERVQFWDEMSKIVGKI